ncbi:hypothetical protein F485_gp275 [Aeromonas phage CC2]|uniref:Uncharacterized protein n=1 Tax=Aeromonas phage CC2 TaxID=1204516 RepID=I6XGI3_9CAUD|nr:hypothetical protein F485_gp275 [Aeromonas phage CC2]AFN39171.1 hypothetical protein CC2_020 [Aeromonas phage CC2]
MIKHSIIFGNTNCSILDIVKTALSEKIPCNIIENFMLDGYEVVLHSWNRGKGEYVQLTIMSHNYEASVYSGLKQIEQSIGRYRMWIHSVNVIVS